MKLLYLSSVLILLLAADTAAGDKLPVIPIGTDAYRQWERWPLQRIGVRAYMRSTYDRQGGNEGADASHFLYQAADDFNVSLDVAGAGVLYFARYNHWHGSPWHYEVDGHDYLVRETSTADPNHPAESSIILPETAFPADLTWTWSRTKGADLIWAPVPFRESFRMAYSRTHYGTGYYIYHQFARGIPLSRSIKSWTPDSAPDPEASRILQTSAEGLTPRPDSAAGRKIGLFERLGKIDLPAWSRMVFLEEKSGPKVIRALTFSVPEDQAISFGRARLRIWWDDRAEPSVDAPIALFFGAGTLYNRDGRTNLVDSFPIKIRSERGWVELRCFFPMPFFHSSRIELSSGEIAFSNVLWSARMAPYRDPVRHATYFHATYRNHPAPEAGKDLVLLDTREMEGSGEWSGHFIGNSWIFSHAANLSTLEGDPRFFFDDSLTPQGQGTGTEEWGGGGDYWGGRNMTLPLVGHPVGARDAASAKNEEDKIESAYRFLLADLMPFGRNARICLEHGGENQSTQHYETVTYWYGIPAATLTQTDRLKVGDLESEQAHQYRSPNASEPYSITSRYEWGVDHVAGKEIYPAATDIGRKTTGTSEFVVTLDPANSGVLLRRKLDYSFPNQRAEVWVADETSRVPRWRRAGIWYLAGSNRCVYSNPRDELGATEHRIQISNRRFRDDEFLIGRGSTEGRSKLRIRLQFIPVRIPVVPGEPLSELAWSEMNYTVYCYHLPRIQL